MARSRTRPGAQDGAGTDRDERPVRSDGLGRVAPAKPHQLGVRPWLRVFGRTVRRFQRDNLMDRAAALTYYSVLSLFPALLAVISVLGLLGRSATQTLVDNLGQVAPGTAKKIISDAIRNLQDSRSTSGILLVVGIAGALWSASGYVGAFTRAANDIYGIPEGRPFYWVRPVQVVVTAVLVVLSAAGALAVVLTGGLAQQAGDMFGFGRTAVRTWDIAKWPVLVLLVMTMLAILYWATPNVKHPGFRWISPGAILAVVIWLIASAGFAFYVANFSNYNKTYGTMGGVIIFLTWLWVGNIAVVLGAAFNAELERGRELEGGEAAEDDLTIPPRRRAKNA